MRTSSSRRNRDFDWFRFLAIFSIVMGSLLMIAGIVLTVLTWPFGLADSVLKGLAFVLFISAIGILFGGLGLLLDGIRDLRLSGI